MHTTLKRFAKLTAGYSLIALLGPFFTILLTPLYTRVLSPTDYGVVDVAFTLSGLLAIFVTLGIDGALNAHFFDGDETYQRNLVTTAVMFVAGLGIIAGFGLALFAQPLAMLLWKDPARQYILYLLAISLLTWPIYGLVGTALKLRMGVKRVNGLALSFLLATALCNVLFVLLLQMKATGIVAASVSTNVLVCGVALWLAYKPLRGQFSAPLLKRLLPTGLGLLPGTLSFLLLVSIDRIMLTQFVSPNDIGLYSIANKLTAMFWVAFGAAWSAWLPMALEMADRPEAREQFSRMFEYMTVGAMFLALGIGIFAPEILSVFTRSVYVPAAAFTLILLIATGPLGVANNLFQIGLYARKKTVLISLTFLVSAVINIILNLILDPLIGVWGAVLATVIAAAILTCLTYIFGQRAMPVPYRWKRVLVLGSLYLGLTLAFLFVPALNSVIIKAGVMVFFGLAILASGIITLHQLQIVWAAARQRLVAKVR